MQSKNLVGCKFGKLTVIKRTSEHTSDGNVIWECQCKCGKTTFVDTHSLNRHNTKSCGCLKSKISINALNALGRVDGTSASMVKSAKIPTTNKSGYKGISKNKKTGKWVAYITFKGKRYHLGLYDNILDAAKMRKLAENNLFKNFLKWYENEVLK